MIVMKARNILFSAMVSAAMIFGACADTATDPDEVKPMDSPAVDSAMPAHVQDPSTAFPQPPVTGTQTDSSRTTDSAQKN
jgi:hypothetical protein